MTVEKTETQDFAGIFKALGDETRVRILLLLNARPRAVNEIVDLFNLAQPTISRHLSLLKQSGLVAATRRGQQIIYSLREDVMRSKGVGFFTQFDCCRELIQEKAGRRK